MMSAEMIVKQIEVLSAMLAEDRPEIEKQIIHEELIKAYRAKIAMEVNGRMTEEVQDGM